jgi:hypothetical protein
MRSSTIYNQIVIVAGGCDAIMGVVNSTKFYNLEEDTWKTLPTMYSSEIFVWGFHGWKILCHRKDDKKYRISYMWQRI